MSGRVKCPGNMSEGEMSRKNVRIPGTQLQSHLRAWLGLIPYKLPCENFDLQKAQLSQKGRA